MITGFSMGLGRASPLMAAAAPLSIIVIQVGDEVVLRVSSVGGQSSGIPRLNALTVDGVSVLGDVSDAISPELAQTPNPGSVSGSNVSVTALSNTIQIGATYLVSYEVLSADPAATLAFPDSGTPFPAASLSTAPGVHTHLVTAETDDNTVLMEANGAMSFVHVSCRKAEWSLTLPAALGPEMASTPTPGRVAGSGSIVTGLIAPLTIGADHQLSYTITEDIGTTNLYTPANAGSPFSGQQLPYSAGTHNLTLPALDADTDAAMRVVGDLTFSNVSIRENLAAADHVIAWDVGVGSSQSVGEATLPAP